MIWGSAFYAHIPGGEVGFIPLCTTMRLGGKALHPVRPPLEMVITFVPEGG